MIPCSDAGITSPINHSNRVEILDRFPTESITNAYRKRFGLDVSRLMPRSGDVIVGKCLDSGYRFYWPPTTVGDEEFYRDLTAIYPHSVSIRWEHKTALSYIRSGMKVLEVGCGPGVFLTQLQNKQAKPVGLELNAQVAKEGQARGFNVEHQYLDAHAHDHAGEYDAVCFFQVIEHVADVKLFLEGALNTIKSGGLVIFAVPNNNPWLFRYDRMHTLNLPPHHMGLWDRQSLESLPDHFEFDLVQVSVEPMLFARKQLEVFFNHHKKPALARFAASLPAVFDKVSGRLFGRLFAGRNVLAVYRKH